MQYVTPVFTQAPLRTGVSHAQQQLSPPREQGAVLVIGLIFLTILMLGAVSMMDSSVMDERMAGNSRASHNAFMAAEAGQHAAVSHVLSNWDSVRTGCAVGNELSAVSDTFNADLNSSYIVTYANCGADNIRLRSEGYAGATAMRAIVFDVKNGLPAVKPPAAISCFGACTVDPGNASDAPIDGRNHPLGPVYNCTKNNIKQCPATASIDPDEAVPSVYLTDYANSVLVPAPGGGNGNGNGNGNGGQKTPFIGKSHASNTIAEGNDKSVASVWDNDDDKFAPDAAPVRSAFFGPGSVVESLLRFSNASNTSEGLGSLESPKITIINQNSSENGNGAFSGYLVVDQGAEFSFGGNATYVGIIFLTGCSHLRVHGTPTIYGAVIVDAQGCTGSGGNPYQPFLGNGTPDVKYSFDALENTSDHIIGLVVDDWYEDIQL